MFLMVGFALRTKWLSALALACVCPASRILLPLMVAGAALAQFSIHRQGARCAMSGYPRPP